MYQIYKNKGTVSELQVTLHAKNAMTDSQLSLYIFI